MQVHRFAEIFPLLDDPEIDKLATDISMHGQRERIVMFREQVLDGRNRAAACERIGIEPLIENFEGDEDAALAFVISKNLRRRHLNESQRANAAARVEALRDRGNGDGDDSSEPAGAPDQPRAAETGQFERKTVTRETIASDLNVSTRSVADAAKLQRQGVPELVRAVDAGDVAVSTAATVSELPEDEQRRAVSQGPAAIRDAAAARKKRPERKCWILPKVYLQTIEDVIGSEYRAIGGTEAFADLEKSLEDGQMHVVPWSGSMLVCPPEQHDKFAGKLISHVSGGSVLRAIAIFPSATETVWFTELFEFAQAAIWPEGRIHFLDEAGGAGPDPGHGHTVFFFGPIDNAHRFVTEFAAFGYTVKALP